MARSAENPVAPRPWAVQDLPPFPRAVIRFVALLSQERADTREIADVVGMDPALGSAILRLVNSAGYATGTRIDSVAQAILRVGTERLKALAYTVGMRAYARGAQRQAAHHRCWQHSIACAFLAQELAAAFDVDSDRAYTAGLLHDVGRLAFLVAYPSAYSAVVTLSINDALGLIEAERAMFDIDHCEAGAYLADDWGFPGELRAAIVQHHAVPTPAGGGLAALVHVACRLTDAIGFPVATPDVVWSLDELRDGLPERLRHSWQPDLGDLAARAARQIDVARI